MNTATKNIQLQFQGYSDTPLLWHGSNVYNLKQFEFSTDKTIVFNRKLTPNLRLGKLVEQFVSEELATQNDVEIVAENYQVQNNKQTIGEIDCLLFKANTPIHLEIIYKFYLYDETVGTTEIEHWIGPNRKDTLLMKLTKLKEKQLPLLYNPFTQPLLNSLNIKVETIKQEVLFKAQLFLPFGKYSIDFKQINEECVTGFYIHHTELQQLQAGKFYIPSKKNWLVNPHAAVDWILFDAFSAEIENLVSLKKSPLCWIKYPNGIIKKFFVVWW
ncbi:DUF1853 family protein [Joostella sp. CR20]|uniref:DUF1853 family protein n=1 Tax=Joostella sp. CR20 TaxID=2804312 RepID=UPI00313EFF57